MNGGSERIRWHVNDDFVNKIQFQSRVLDGLWYFTGNWNDLPIFG